MTDNTHTKPHPYHLVDPSAWPLLGALSALVMAVGAVLLMHERTGGMFLFPAGLLLVLFTMYVWWQDVIKEGHTHHHNTFVQHGLRIGMALFILSEVMFFFAFFWSFFKFSIFPVDIIDDFWPIAKGIWPPDGIETLDPWDLPLINTVILLLSGTTVTWAHHALLQNNNRDVIRGLGCTIFLGLSFTAIQAFEYSHATFGFKEGIYSSNFYMATGFHGFHVIVGTLFLLVCYIRALNNDLHIRGHLGFEFAAWYWHFVDVVWLFLFIFVYVWGS